MVVNNKFLIIAGMPCSGKSTLLRHCLESGIPAFGDSHNFIFRSTSIPPFNKENSASLEDRIENRYWLHELDLYFANEKRIKLESHVIHFDLYWYFISVVLPHLKINEQDLNTLQIIKKFSKIEKNLIAIFKTFRNFVPDNTEVVLGILDTTYDDLCDRWVCRTNTNLKHSNRHEFLRQHLFNYSIEGKEICESFVTAARKAFDFAEQIEIKSLMPNRYN
jgi:hypothetical protein